MSQSAQLNRTLGPLMLWGLGVGYVISGMYFGWNLGLEQGGVLGLAIATFFIIIMYVSFTLSYTELACAIPKAGGGFDYSLRAFGPKGGFIAGMAQNIEFIFAPPAIAYAIGAYMSSFVNLPVEVLAIGAYLIFTTINIVGVRLAAVIELTITILAVVELLIFAGFTLPSFDAIHLTQHSLPNGYASIFIAIPYAIWFFLAIEGIANVAEETINPQRNVLIGFGTAMFTLVVLCAITFISAVGVNGWETVVFDTNSLEPSDSPLPLALKSIYGEQSFVYHLLITIGLLGLVASFHGIILAAGRSTLEFGRFGFAPKFTSQVHRKFKTPANALILNMLIGIIAILTGKTAAIITLACFGALTLYIISFAAFFKLRRTEPDMERPFKAPLYPAFQVVGFCIAIVALIAMSWFNQELAGLFVMLIVLSYILFGKNQIALAQTSA